MTIIQIASCVAFALLLAVGQILFKTAALAMRPLKGVADVVYAVQLPVLWGALILYGSATILWVVILQTVPLSRAYPFAALGFVIVPAAGAIFFGERLTQGFLVGLALVLAGLVVLARS